MTKKLPDDTTLFKEFLEDSKIKAQTIEKFLIKHGYLDLNSDIKEYVEKCGKLSHSLSEKRENFNITSSKKNSSDFNFTEYDVNRELYKKFGDHISFFIHGSGNRTSVKKLEEIPRDAMNIEYNYTSERFVYQYYVYFSLLFSELESFYKRSTNRKTEQKNKAFGSAMKNAKFPNKYDNFTQYILEAVNMNEKRGLTTEEIWESMIRMSQHDDRWEKANFSLVLKTLVQLKLIELLRLGMRVYRITGMGIKVLSEM